MGLATTSMAGTLFQSTPPARGATVNGQLLVQIPFISIHAPREGGDGLCAALGVPFVEFQSTPPARGATWRRLSSRSKSSISIHAPREGGDLDGMGDLRILVHFNPRPPRGGRL